MRIEVLCTGDELLTGVVPDTNSPWFMARLLRLGERVSRTTVVGDDRAAIRDALGEIAERADVVLVSGGLGPTADDVTAEAAAEAAGVALVEDVATVARLRERYARRQLPLSPNVLRQARVPAGAEVGANDVGAAPFFALTLGRCRALFVPGVPAEYRHLVETQVLPRIERWRAPGSGAFSFRILKTIGLPEARLDEQVAPLSGRHPGVTFGFRVVPPESHLELLARGTTPEDAAAKLAAAEKDARAVLGECVFGADEDTLAHVVVSMLGARGETLTVAESCTGGLVAAALTDVAGASQVFPGGAITYGAALKTAFADVPAELIAAKGEVSAEVARSMAEGIRARTGTTWAIAVTGYAGPGGGDPREPVGAVHLAVAGPTGMWHERHHFIGDRERVRRFATGAALDLLRRRLHEREGER
ncbi:MAG: CinA family nicotinamide mononucleotide deamidase-related protein [Myxococcaceae bacterium]|nr:CinA family nicotinamide mononucleotide deamidase-related protein [Myxococcaceae bacterium]